MNSKTPSSDVALAASAFQPLDPVRIQRLNALVEEVRRLVEPDAEQSRYGAAAEQVEEALCCPVTYDATALSHIPERILAIDYGCGDPTVFAEAGMTVLDLGSGSGKHAFMIARSVGENGRVIGVDKTPAMLALARGAVDEVNKALGYAAQTVTFRHGHIENLYIDKDRLLGWLSEHDLASYEDAEALETYLHEAPLVASDSVDLVVSNCVLNLVEDTRKRALLSEVFRVLKRGGSVAISDIVADRPIPAELKKDAELWTGCLSGAWQRDEFLDAFAAAGFYGMVEVATTFWKRVADINFFSMTVRAYKGKQGPCYETYRQAMYRGPFSRVVDDDGHVYERGQFVPVCEKTAAILGREPYERFFHVSPALADPSEKIPFDCSPKGVATTGGFSALTKEQAAALNRLIDEGACCDGEGCC